MLRWSAAKTVKSRESLDMCIVGITVKISDYVVDNVPLGHYQGVTGSVQEHLVTPQMCLRMISKASKGSLFGCKDAS